MISKANDILEEARSEEEEAYENLPEQFRYGERGEEMDTYVAMLEEACGYLDDATNVIEQI